MHDPTALLLALLRAGLSARRGEPQGPCPVGRSLWETVAQTAIRTGMASVVLDTVRRCWPEEALPDGAARALHTARLETAARNAALLHTLDRIARACRDADIPLIALKGAQLLSQYYPDPSFRAMSDIDVLVREDGIERLDTAMLDLGFARCGDHTALRRERFHVGYMSDDGFRAFVEVHWALLKSTRFPVNTAGCWRRATPATTPGGAPILVLSPEDALLHLSHHTAYAHVFGAGLRSLYDVAVLLEAEGERIDWDRLADRAHRWGMERCLYLVLRLTAETLGGRVPPSALRALEPRDGGPHALGWAMAHIRRSGVGSHQHAVLNLRRWKDGDRAERATLLKRLLSPRPTETATAWQTLLRTPWHLLTLSGVTLRLCAGYIVGHPGARAEVSAIRLVSWLADNAISRGGAPYS